MQGLKNTQAQSQKDGRPIALHTEDRVYLNLRR